jgi:organic radical activating enzyme
MVKARVSEVFKSIQGEGVYQGIPQLFIRFFGCNMRCAFCDTNLSYYEENTVSDVLEKVFSYRGYHSVSFTGGEPLLQVKFLKEITKYLKKEGEIIYLETNGTLYKNLREVIEYIDIIAMDFKLPSSTGLRGCWEQHQEFLKIAQRKEVFVKSVICNFTVLDDIKKAINIIAKIDKNIPFVLQPNFFEIGDKLNNKLEEFFSFSQKYLKNAGIIGQLHKVVNCK